MKIILFGATGMVGKQIIVESSLMGHALTAYTRQTQLPTNIFSLISGDLDDEAKIADAIKDAEIVISALGSRDYDSPVKVISPFVQLVVRHLQPEQRLVIVAGSGLTLAASNLLRRDLPGQPERLRHQRADHWEAYSHVAPLDIDYLFVCPTMIVEGDSNGRYLVGERYFPKSECRQILSGNVAHFITRELEEKKFKQTRIGLVDELC